MSGNRERGLSFFVAFTFAWCALFSVRVPLLTYFPLERRFGFPGSATTLPMDFYGRVLFALGAGALAALLAPSGETWRRRLTAWSLLVFFFTAGLCIYSLVDRPPAEALELAP